MPINDLLSKKRKSIINKSFELTIATYPEKSQTFLREKKQTIYKPCWVFHLSSYRANC
jgi:hypothetical protein